MIDDELYRKIRRHSINGHSQRHTAECLGISRATVAKYGDGAHIPGKAEERAPKESAGKASVKAAIRKYYEEHKDGQTRKHKINGHTLWRDLHYEHPRSEATYRRYWAEIRGERQVKTRLPLTFGIAEAAELDWKMAEVRLRGTKIRLHVLCVNLMYAYTPFKKAYPDEKQHNLIDGLACAMEFFGGSPAKLIMDNMTTARKKGYGKKAELTDEFKLFCAHYGVEAVFCNPYEPEEKGAIEVAAKTAGGILTPIIGVDSISEVNDKLLKECLNYISHTGRVGNRPRTVKEMTEEEKPHLTPLPVKRYEVGVHDKVSVSNLQTFEYDRFLYSVPRLYAGKEIGIIAYAFSVQMYYKGKMIWECDRPVLEGLENRVYAEHFEYDLSIKPRARENAFPLLEGILPPELRRFRELCKSKTTKCSQLFMLMQKMKEVGRDALLGAVSIANDSGVPTYEKVEEILLRGASPAIGDNSTENAGQNPTGDDFYVEQRDPADYAALFGDSDSK